MENTSKVTSPSGAWGAATLDFIQTHREDDVRTLALKGQRDAAVDMTFALQQIDGWQRARVKLPMWAEREGIIYPPHVSMEQCSSERTALYKWELVQRLLGETNGAEIADLTGGFGVDFSYLSQGFKEAYYVEQQEHLCDIAKHNFEVLGMDNAHIINGVAEDVLPTLPQLDVIYLDPARRDVNGRKTYAISDCTPDVCTLLPQLKARARFVVVKLSPMLDHREAVRLLPGVFEVHIISVRNECKEMLLVIDGSEHDSVRVVCVNDESTYVTTLADSAPVLLADSLEPGMQLFVPNVSVMKAGCFGNLCRDFNLAALGQSSHLFVSLQKSGKNEENAHFTDNMPCKSFMVRHVCSLNKRDLKPVLSGVTHANVLARNFPLTTDQLRKKLQSVSKFKDGGDTWVIATTFGRQHVVILCNG